VAAFAENLRKLPGISHLQAIRLQMLISEQRTLRTKHLFAP